MLWGKLILNALPLAGILGQSNARPASIDLTGPHDAEDIDVLSIGPLQVSYFKDILANITAMGTHDTKLDCAACKAAVGFLKLMSHMVPRVFDHILSTGCEGENGSKGFCSSKQHYTMRYANMLNFIPDFRNMLEVMDPSGPDGNNFCHFVAGGLCPLPDAPAINHEDYWPPEPRNLVVPQSKGTTFRVTHVSDVHLSLGYVEGAPAMCAQAMCCTKNSFRVPFRDQLDAPKFGYYQCDTPTALMESSLANLANTTTSDFAIFTGDLVDHDPAFISKRQTIKEEVAVMKSLKAHLSGIPVYATLGNHDSYPFSQIAPRWTGDEDRFSFNVKLMHHLWGDFGWLPEQSLKQVATHYGAFSVMAKPKLKIISLNSNFWYRWNFYNYAGTDDPDNSGMLKFLIKELLDCERRGLRAWIIAHVPSGGTDSEALPGPSHLFTATVQRFSKTIANVFFGHTHRDEFTVYYKHKAPKTGDNALGIAWVAPSITPLTDFNPAWRYYEVDSETFEIMDSRTYYSEIDKHFHQSWDQTDDLLWKQEYSARNHYTKFVPWPATAPLNGTFWHNVATTVFSNAAMTADYMQLAYRNSSKTPGCDKKCRHDKLCFATSMSVNQAARCKDAYSGTQRRDFHGVPGYPMPRDPRI